MFLPTVTFLLRLPSALASSILIIHQHARVAFTAIVYQPHRKRGRTKQASPEQSSKAHAKTEKLLFSTRTNDSSSAPTSPPTRSPVYTERLPAPHFTTENRAECAAIKAGKKKNAPIDP